MGKYLVIVESPAKSKTIKKYLGKDFDVMASYGHIRDLVPKSGSVDPDHDFAMKYGIVEKSAQHVEKISKALKKAEALYLATDPDREGEAISWHIVELMKEKKILGDKPVYRVAFNEITKSAVVDAVAHPRAISMELVHAQLARRALDYLVGFNLSPLLWKKIRRGLSAGRVQSPALRMIVERELEIEAFKSQEYWTIEADSQAVDNKDQMQPFSAKLISYLGEKLKQFSINEQKQAEAVQQKLLEIANGKLQVHNVEKKKRKRNPAAPFITSTLQQEASRKLGLSTRQTMRIAQQLYEGIEIGVGTVGLITYMRTDSVNLAQEALTELREYIEQRYGADHLPEEIRRYKTKAKNAQEAHEAIRPTSIKRTPEQVKQYLKPEQYKLYNLIWKRTLACQMIHATINTVAIDFVCLDAGPDVGVFRATGSTIANPGFMTVYLEGVDDQRKDDSDGKLLPPLNKGDIVDLQGIRCEQHFTEPPPRYSEASLVKSLEEHGIGRPSTYSSIITTLQTREYVILEKKRFLPTDVGRIVNKFLTQYFEKYVDYNFTAQLEDQLDAVSRGEGKWIPLLDDFWRPFNQQVNEIEKSVQRSDVTTEAIEEVCPKCSKPLVIRLGRRGRFIGCTGFPECDYTGNVGNEVSAEPETVEGRQCPKCQSDLIIKSGPYGKFIGCSSYPKCKFIEPLEKPKDTNILCPVCLKGNIVQRRSRKGKVFYSCSGYPDCKYAIWDPPIDESCPNCKWPIMTLKTTKSRGEEKLCPRVECKTRISMSKENE